MALQTAYLKRAFGLSTSQARLIAGLHFGEDA